jgi:hypothetical protein
MREYRHYPLQQRAGFRRLSPRTAFVHSARSILQKPRDCLLRRSGEGLMVLAKDENALMAATSTLRDYFGPDLHLSAPQVRLIGKPPREPIMHVRVNVPVFRIELVKQQLHRRSVALPEKSRGGTRCLLQGEAPLTRLLGLSADLDGVTLGRALVWTKLVRYEPCLRPLESTAA